MNNPQPKPEQTANELFREGATSLTETMTGFLRRQQTGTKELGDDGAKAVATMIKIWSETGDYFIQRVRAEFPGIRDRQDIELIIEETREPPEG